MEGTRTLTRIEARLGARRQARPRDVNPVRWWLRRRVWPLPLLGALVGAGLGVLLVDPPPLVLMVLGGRAWQTNAGEARSMLATVLGIALTSLSIVLSLSMLVVQSAASQYSPRLLRLYLHGAGIRVVIPVFVATSVFCLFAVHEFGFVSAEETRPRPALGVAMLLLLACEAALVFHVLNTLQLMRVENLVRRVGQDTLRVARMLERRRQDDVAAPPATPAPLPGGRPLRARKAGFVVDVDASALLAVAEARRLVIHVGAAIGAPVVEGAVLGRVEPERGPLAPEVAEALEHAILLGRWRVQDTDVTLGLRQLVDMAIKALSPGINDPYTAVEAVDQLTVLLCELCRMRLGPRALADGEGRPRVFLSAPTLGECLELATDQIARYGAGEPAVMLRLLRLAGEVGQHARSDTDRQAARETLHRVRQAAERAQAGSPQLEPLRRHAEAVERALDGGDLPPLPAIGF